MHVLSFDSKEPRLLLHRQFNVLFRHKEKQTSDTIQLVFLKWCLSYSKTALILVSITNRNKRVFKKKKHWLFSFRTVVQTLARRYLIFCEYKLTFLRTIQFMKCSLFCIIYDFMFSFDIHVLQKNVKSFKMEVKLLQINCVSVLSLSILVLINTSHLQDTAQSAKLGCSA